MVMDRATKRRRQNAIRKIEKHPNGVMTAIADQTIPNLFENCTHECGAPAEIDRYWRIAACSACGVVPCEEMR